MTSKYEIEKEKVKNGVEAILKVNEAWKTESKKKSLLTSDEDEFIYLQVQMKKIPYLNNIAMIKVPLPHTLITDSTSICLFTKDLKKEKQEIQDKKDESQENKKAELVDVELSVHHYKELLEKLNIKCITEVITLRQLKTDYKPYEAKRQLVKNFDVFLADSKIASYLPRYLGKFFFQKRKFPQQVDMINTCFLKESITNLTSKTLFFLTGKGTTCIASVAHLGLSKKQIIDNVLFSALRIAENIPGGLQNVSGLYLKFSRSVSVPIYISLDTTDVVLPSKPQIITSEPEEISTLSKSKVKVHANGFVELFPDEVSEEDAEFRDSEDEMLQKDIVSRRNLEMKRKNKNNEKNVKKKLKKFSEKNVTEIKKNKGRHSSVSPFRNK